MPMMPKLSRNFYDRFGEDVVNELVEWFNSMDATYRTDLRELNDRNFVRFEAGLDRRSAEIDASIERRFAQVDVRFAKLEARFDQRFASLESLLREHMATIDVRMAHFEARMMRWMLTFWVGTLGGLAALVWAMMRAR